MGRPSQQTQAKRQREQAKKEKRDAKERKRAVRKAAKDSTGTPGTAQETTGDDD